MQMRYAVPVSILLGLVMGAVGAAMWKDAAYKREAYPHGVMAVLGAQVASLDKSVKASRCTSSDLLPRFQTLRAVANDIEPAFGEDDERFAQHAGSLRAATDAAMTTPPASCQAAAAMLGRVRETCSGCHHDFKD
jgi:cytochrome c556